MIVDIAHEDVDQVFTYAVPEGMTLQIGMRVWVPFGKRVIQGFVVDFCTSTTLAFERIKNVQAPIDDYPVLLEGLLSLAVYMKSEYRCTMASALRVILPAQVRSGKLRPLTRLAARLTVTADVALAACVRAQKQREIVQILSSGEDAVRIGQIPVEGALALVRALEKKGLVEVFPVPVRRAPSSGWMQTEKTIHLTCGQQSALDAIAASLDGDTHAFLLHGVTGSGKTEVYLRAVHQVLQRGKGAIFLVPEISLTPQMVSWFRARFGDAAAVLHSGLSQGERFDEWRRIRDGQARIVIGARSAVFAPVESLGLIVVDEEHEQSYHSEQHPCYDARQVALARCRFDGATLVLGSATPSIDTYARTLRGHYVLLEMPERAASRPMPDVEIVDMRSELIAGNRSIFSGSLRLALRETLEHGQQAVLFINRRGHSSYVKCRACGYTVHCPHCDVTMTYHMSDETLRCHYCNSFVILPKTCPQCASEHIRFFGIGTQKVEELFQKEFPGISTVRLDLDTTQGKGSMESLLGRFRMGKAQVMIGTQMIAKGHDFPNVTLVGVMAADLTLNLPDYRSEERTFQLLTQVEGRAGRGELRGRVVVQSYEPEHYAIAMAAKQDYRAFYTEEIKRRRRRLYPPYTQLLRLLFASKEDGQARAASELFHMELEKWFGEKTARKALLIHMRQMEAPLSRLRDVYRYQVFIKLYARDCDEAVDDILEMIRGFHEEGVRAEAEINPASFM